MDHDLACHRGNGCHFYRVLASWIMIDCLLLVCIGASLALNIRLMSVEHYQWYPVQMPPAPREFVYILAIGLTLRTIKLP